MVFGLEAARSLAVSPLVTGSFSRPYLEAACKHILAALHSNNLRRARRLNEVLLAAVASDIADEPDRCRTVVWLTWLNVVKTVLSQLPDGALFTSAGDIEASLLSLAESFGDRNLACHARYHFAGVLVAPYIEGTVTTFEPRVRRWLTRGLEADLPPTEVIPRPSEAFALAEGRLLAGVHRGEFAVGTGSEDQQGGNRPHRGREQRQRHESVVGSLSVTLPQALCCIDAVLQQVVQPYQRAAIPPGQPQARPRAPSRTP